MTHASAARRSLPILTAVAYAAVLIRWFHDPGAAGPGSLRSAAIWPWTVPLFLVAIGTAVVHRPLLSSMAAELKSAWLSSRRDLLLLGIVLVVSFLFQLPAVLFPAGLLHSDASINGLMAMHIADGRVAPPFYYGQLFLGTLFSHVLALVFVVTGPFVGGLTLLVWAFYAGFLAAIFIVVRQASGSAVAFVVGLWLSAPPTLLLTTLVQTEYAQLLFFSAWALAIVGARCGGLLTRDAWWAVAGGLLGLAFWAHPFALAAVAGVGVTLALLLSVPALVRASWLVASGFAVGVLPAVIGWGRDLPVFLWWLLSGAERGGDATFLAAVSGLARVSLGNLFLGTEGGSVLSASLALPVAGAFAAAIIWPVVEGLRYRFGSTLESNAGTAGSNDPSLRRLAATLPAAAFVLLHLVPLVSRNAYATTPSHYLVPLYIGIPALVAVALHASIARFRLATPITVVLIAVWTLLPLGRSIDWMRSLPQNQATMDRSIAALRAAGVNQCLGPYWDAYRLSYLTQEQIVCESIDVRRVPHYRELVAPRGGEPPKPFVAAPQRGDSLDAYEAVWIARGARFGRVVTPRFVALVPSR